MRNEGNQQATCAGIGSTGLLTIVFITLKLCGAIDWPWLWVLSPIWISLALVAVAFAILVVAMSLARR